MEYKTLGTTYIKVSVLCLGTWAFGGDRWWGPQKDEDSWRVLKIATEKGINFIDTAPVYGRGHSEKIIGEFIKQNQLRNRIVIATKVGLRWQNGRIYHDLRKDTMLKEIEESLKRLQTDYIDVYQIHWPDKNTPIKESAKVMGKLFREGVIKAVGVSNYSVEQIKEFIEFCPLHVVQPPYNMFSRQIEKDLIPFCIENNIAIINYIPLHSGILTGKFFFENISTPQDLCRKNHLDLKEPRLSINKHTLERIKQISIKYNKTLTQFVLNWTYHRPGITSTIVGARNKKQIQENLGAVGWKISSEDLEIIEKILEEREYKLNVLS